MSPPLRFLLLRDRVVQAGAGTGKTHALLSQYLHLCAGATAHGRPIPPQQICALTFTEKAATEMRERLVRRVTAICRQLGAVGSEDAATALAETEPDLVASAAHLGSKLPSIESWDQVLSSLSGATISTFHAFAAALLRRYAQVIGVDPEFALLDEDSAAQRLRETCEELVLSALEEPTTISSDPEFPSIVAQLLTELGFSSGIGGDGGLIEVLCRLHRQLAEEGQPGDRLTSAYDQTNFVTALADARGLLLSSLQELAARADEIGGKRGEKAALLGGLAAQIGQRLASIDDIAALRSEFGQVTDCFRTIRGPSGAKADPVLSQSIKDWKQQAKDAIDDLQALSVSQKAAPLAKGLALLLAPLSERFSRLKHEEAVLDFSDLLSLARNLLRDHPTVRHELRQRFQVFLIDEFQDTSPIQAELVTLLVGDEGHSPGRLYIVGDRKQSIYDFRGADVAAFTRLCQRLRELGADEETLDRSYRSLPGVLQFVNRLFAQVMQPPSGQLPDWFVRWDPENDPLKAQRSDETVATPQVELLRPTNPAPANPQGDAVKIPSIVREANLIAERIDALLADGVRPGQIVVLLRRFTHLLHYTTALRRKRIPHYVVRGRGFFAAQEVRDLASLLRLLDDPSDVQALVAVLRSPLCGLSDESLARLHLAGRLSLPALCETPSSPGEIPDEPDLDDQPAHLLLRLPADEMNRLRHIVSLLGLLTTEADRFDPADLFTIAIEACDYRAVLAADPDGGQRLANLDRLIERARAYSGRLRAFARFLRLQTDPDLARLNGDPSDEPAAQMLSEHDDAVRIMTVHQAKGLEFPTVIVGGCTTRERHDTPQVVYDRELGLGLSIYVDGERRMTLQQKRIATRRKQRVRAESDRLFYVAATRAKDRLIWAGESDSGIGSTWRQPIEQLIGEADTAALCTEWSRATPVPESAAEPPTKQVPTTDPAAAEESVRLFYEPPLPPSTKTTLVTALAAERLACARRYQLLAQRPAPSSRPQQRARTSDETMHQTAQACLLAGTLAQRLLSVVDLSRRGEDVSRAVAQLGILRDSALAAEAQTWLHTLLRSRWLSDALGQADCLSSLRRGLCYHVPIATDSPLWLSGVLDLTWLGTDGTPHVVDIQLLTPPTKEHAFFVARRTLLARVASTLYRHDGPVRVGLLFLKDADPQPRFTWHTQSQVDDALTELTRPPIPWHGPQLGLLPIRPLLECQELGCELRALCHRAQSLA